MFNCKDMARASHTGAVPYRRGDSERRNVMSEENLVRQCAPTLAGIKTGTIFPVPFDDLPTLTAEIRDLNRLLVPKGLRLLPLRYRDGTALLYLYRPAELRRDLTDHLAEALLEAAGYNGRSSEQCVAHLARRFQSGGEFPHEVGLFLSYPPRDVQGFIENHAVNYKCAGLWKVYGDVELAQSLFAKYRKCTDIYCHLWKAGADIGQLAVAV